MFDVKTCTTLVRPLSLAWDLCYHYHMHVHLIFFALLFHRLRVFFVFITQLGTRQIVCSQKVKQIERKMARYHNDVLGGCSQHACCQRFTYSVSPFCNDLFFSVQNGESPGFRKGEAIFSRNSWNHSLNGTKSRFYFQLLQFQWFSVKKTKLLVIRAVKLECSHAYKSIIYLKLHEYVFENSSEKIPSFRTVPIHLNLPTECVLAASFSNTTNNLQLIIVSVNAAIYPNKYLISIKHYRSMYF